jgi:hypothetical protein
MPSRGLVFAAILLAIASISISHAQKPASAKQTPEDVAKPAMLALFEGRLEEYASRFHPAELEKLRTMMMGLLEEVARQEVPDIEAALDGVTTVEQARRLNAREFLVALMKKRLPKGSIETAEVQPLGHVAEGPETVHVVYRATLKTGDVTVRRLSVVTLLKTQDGWGLAMLGEFDGVVDAMKRSIRQKR